MTAGYWPRGFLSELRMATDSRPQATQKAPGFSSCPFRRCIPERHIERFTPAPRTIPIQDKNVDWALARDDLALIPGQLPLRAGCWDHRAPAR
jgi:hypothetical protein